MPTDIVQLIGNPRLGSRTGALAGLVTEAVVARLAGRGVTLTGSEVLELANAVAVTFSPEVPAVATFTVADPFALVAGARLLVVATPAYKGSYTGILKVFLDAFGQSGLDGVVVVGVAVAGNPAHAETVAAGLTNLFGALGATVPADPIVLLEPDVVNAPAAIEDWLDKHAAALAAAFGQPAP